MGWFALTLAVLGAICATLPTPGLYFAMGLGIFAIGAGIVGFKRRHDPGLTRMAGAGAITVGLLALVLGVTKYGLTLAALRRLESLF